MQSVKTADGSDTLFNDRYNEHYHSVSEGALRETLEKHIRPALRYSNALAKRAIRVLDICFGLGYNSLATIAELNRAGYAGAIEIVSPELDDDLLRELPNLAYPAPLDEYTSVIAAVASDRRYRDDRVSCEVVAADAAEFVQTLNGQFDIIYQDPFSLRKNPTLWDDRFFGALYSRLAEGGVLTTYSASHAVRKTMKTSGFLLYEHPFAPESGMRKGTIGAKTAIGGLECLRG
ncbi:hypothetical protein AGMMS50229_01750 [Campylobacterota bacterium]|nr:hypothetical protein AGMMS50229_01750 [Campylobacterota bacterium]